MPEVYTPKTPIQAVVEEPAMVMGFLPTNLHAKLRQMANERGCSESQLVSSILREALTKRPRLTKR